MTKFVIFVGRVAITAVCVEMALIGNELLKQTKIDTAKKQANSNEEQIVDILHELDEVKERLAALELD
jgi:hypothetical protein